MNDPLRKRSLEELDDVIDEIIERNPEFVKKLLEYVEQQRGNDEQSN